MLIPELSPTGQRLFGVGAVGSVVLIQFPVKRLAPDAQRASGVCFISAGVIKRGFDCLALYFIHRREQSLQTSWCVPRWLPSRVPP